MTTRAAIELFIFVVLSISSAVFAVDEIAVGVGVDGDVELIATEELEMDVEVSAYVELAEETVITVDVELGVLVTAETGTVDVWAEVVELSDATLEVVEVVGVRLEATVVVGVWLEATLVVGVPVEVDALFPVVGAIDWDIPDVVEHPIRSTLKHRSTNPVDTNVEILIIVHKNKC